MKKVKKMLSAILALAMIMSMIVLPVSAEEAPEMISVGETKTVTLDADEMQLYLFTPTESCRYIAYAPYNTYWLQIYEGTEIDLDAEVNGNWMTQDYQYDGTAFDAEAGKTYLIRMDNCWSGETRDCELNLIKAQNYESLEFNQPDSSGFPGDLIGIDFTSAPMFASEDLTWTISDPTIAEIENTGFTGVNVLLKTAGTATLTVTASSGISASCTVTVKGRETIAFGETKEFTLDYYLDTEEFLFTPTESGRYIVATPYGGPSCGLYEGTEPSSDNIVSSKSWSDSEGNYSGAAFTAEAGKTYLLSFTSWKDRVIESSVTIMAATTYETLYFKEDYFGRVGEVNGLNVYGTPGNASEAITWTSSNPEVATISGTDDYGYLELVGPGTAVITATADSGASASCKVTATAVVDLKAGDSVDVTIEPGTYAYFTFTPAESGRYIFYTPADAWLGFSAEENQNYDPVRGSEWTNADGSYSGDAFELTAGVTYRIDAYIRGEQNGSVTTKVGMVKAANFDTFALSKETLNRFAGDSDRINIVATPDFASEAVTWETSDPSVVNIDSAYDGYIYPKYIGAGTATITATTATGKVATCSITVREPIRAEKNVEYTAAVDVEKHIPIDFTAPEDGVYTLAVLGGGNYYVSAWDQDGQYVEDTDTYHRRGVRCETFEMKTGETLRFNLHNESGSETEFRFMIGNNLQATHITLPIAEETVYVGNTFQLRVFYEPILAMEETATWEISDPEVIMLRKTHYTSDEGGYEYYEFITKKTGTVTLTATSESGLQASCMVHVTEPPVIGLGKQITKPLFAEDYTLGFHQVDEFVFIPEVTGEYNLYWEKDSIDESTFFYWNGYYTVLEGTAWENEYYSGIRVQLNGMETLEEPKKELEELEKALEAMPEGEDKEEKKQELENKKWEFEELIRGVYTSIAVHNATQEPTQITFYLEAHTGEDPIIHTHAPKPVAEKKATFTENGMKAHYACECGTLFADEAGTTEVTEAELIIPKLIQVEDGKAEVSKEAIDDAVAEVEQGGEVSIPVADAGTGSEEEVKSAALPVESLTQITEKEATLTVEMPAATVTMDTAALAAVVEKAGENASVTLEVAEVPKEDLTETQMAAIEKLDQNLVTTISAELLVNDQPIASEADGGFGGGKVTVKVPVKISGKDFQVVYIADDGSTTVIENATYENGILTMELEHFSTYAIVQDSLPGDADGNGLITILDLMRLANYFAKGVEINEANADVNGDGQVTILDLMRLANYFAGNATLG